MRILSVIAILIAYGSLYPGNFSASGADVAKTFLTDWRLFTSRGDLLGNLALFFPLGMASMLFAPNGLNSRIRVALALFLAFIFSFTLQLAQVWLPSRSAALADVVWNMAGMALGMATAHLARKRLPAGAHAFDFASLTALSVLALWLLTELLPLVPSLDWQKFKNALKPLFLDYSVSPPIAIMRAAGVIIAGSAFVTLSQRPVLWLSGAVALIMAGKIAIVNLTLDASILTGLLGGYLGFLIVLRLSGIKILGLAFWLLFAAWSTASLMPFSPVSGGSFNGIPFATMLHGSMETGVRGLVQSLFVYTALLWLAQKTGAGIGKAIAGLTLWSCLIELMQMGLLGRTADVTEPILLLLVGWVLSITRSFDMPARREARVAASQPQPRVANQAAMSGKQALGLIVIGVAICVAIGWLITQSPLTPYNIRELVYDGHPLRSLVLLVSLLYWAVGFPVLIARWLTRGWPTLLGFPPLVLLHGLIAWLLLWSAVPSESIHDIVGSPVLAWPWEWELLGRFLALFSFWSLMATAGSLVAAQHALSGAKSALFGWLAGACLLIPISYYVVVVAAATDNLVELIAGGGSAIAFLLIGVAITGIVIGGTTGALALIPGIAWRIRAVAWVLGSGVLAWLALYFGTEQVIIKYGHAFSALQFLLSSDRSHLAEPGELVVRYIVLYGLLVAIIVMVQHPLWRWIISASPQPAKRMAKGMPPSATA